MSVVLGFNVPVAVTHAPTAPHAHRARQGECRVGIRVWRRLGWRVGRTLKSNPHPKPTLAVGFFISAHADQQR